MLTGKKVLFLKKKQVAAQLFKTKFEFDVFFL